MENNEIMERLLQDDKDTKSSWKHSSSKSYSNWEIQTSRIRVVTAKFKVYIVLLLLLLAILWVNYIPKENNKLDTNSAAYDQANAQLKNIENDIKIAKDDMDYLCSSTDGIVNNEESLKTCLNEREGCLSLPTSWKKWPEDDMHYDLSVPISYLQLNSLWNEKMPVDEKRVLKNLNEYLIKQDISWNDRTRIWDILKISIGDPEQVEWWEDHFFMVTVDVEIEFSTVNDLTGFLYNVEKKMVDNREDRILYKIQSVSYDIVTNDEPQVTDISMIAYYYHDERFDDMEECGNNASENKKEKNDNEDSNSANSDWFLQGIFNKFKK